MGDNARGARTVTANLHELARRRIITLTAGGAGMPNTITLLDEQGNEQPYRRPAGPADGGSYFRVPEAFWTTGLIGEVSGPGLAMYLILLYYHRRSAASTGARDFAEPTPTWFSENSFRQRHGLSEDTRLAGIQNLRDLGAIQVNTVSIDSSGGNSQRRYQRRHVTLNPRYEPPPRGEKPDTGARKSLVELPSSETAFSTLRDRLK
ncbi:hypothetical protein [Mycobacterium servetii]|uniref:Uncharacterized protein n=1 Tax=Mycobacterium servetii TaxID=3237418 RepID=A0ABV4C6V1_9MYCO